MQTLNQRIEELYVSKYNHLCNQVRRWVGPPNAEDVVQEAFTRALKYKRSWNPEYKTLGAWFKGILNNAARDKKQEERMQGMSGPEYYESEELDTTMAKSELVEKVISEMDTSINSEVLRMFFVLGYTRKEIAEVVELTPKYIGNVVYEFRKSMQEKYGDQYV